MPHPVMFNDDDFGLAELRAMALSLPGAGERISHGRPAFFASKMFAMYGGNSRTTGAMVAYPYSVLVKVERAERAALERDPRFFSPAYLGPSGWLGLDLTAGTGPPGAAAVEREVDWVEVGELLDASYRQVAGSRLILELDRRSRGAP
ncbi:MmcQ/YjbR family DNA-binding protein [Mycolicibacterium palauense]|uniref:MmcQ/YjbR family DNA-binding protein n=1 Tax=Mycolicibacterium palauense TaxID=2034511 RepID=UPI000BFEC85B|nr:MmcQ/YjbR family DNA-binding protein [Mycolicibacterium palauense]